MGSRVCPHAEKRYQRGPRQPDPSCAVERLGKELPRHLVVRAAVILCKQEDVGVNDH
jgi:hypothetical protein